MTIFIRPTSCSSNKLFKLCLWLNIRKRLSSHGLYEIGHFEAPKLVTNYPAGQTFVHKLLGYRGLIISSWMAQVYNQSHIKSEKTNNDEKFVGIDQKQTYYYQVLIDSRDVPFTRIRSERPPLLIKLEKRLHTLPDSDFAGHDDILPYTVTQKQKFQHELLGHFFEYYPEKTNCYQAKKELMTWQEKTVERLKLMDIYSGVTENVRITVMPFFIGLRKTRQYVRFFWKYTIRLETLDGTTVTVKNHKLRIFCCEGSSIYKTGIGIAGVEPTLTKSHPVFQYNGFVTLRAPCGHVRGILEMQREDGSMIHFNVPMFLLQSCENC